MADAALWRWVKESFRYLTISAFVLTESGPRFVGHVGCDWVAQSARGKEMVRGGRVLHLFREVADAPKGG
jgi:hypothetical protein